MASGMRRGERSFLTHRPDEDDRPMVSAIQRGGSSPAIATALEVVPRSIPMILAMLLVFRMIRVLAVIDVNGKNSRSTSALAIRAQSFQPSPVFPALRVVLQTQSRFVFSGLIEFFFDHSGQVGEQPVALADVGRTVHDGQRFRFEIGQRAQDSFGLPHVRHVAGQRSLL